MDAEQIVIEGTEEPHAVRLLDGLWGIFERERGKLEDALGHIQDDPDGLVLSAVRHLESARAPLVVAFASFEQRHIDDESWRGLGVCGDRVRYMSEYAGALRSTARSLRMLIEDEREAGTRLLDEHPLSWGETLDADFEELDKYAATAAGMDPHKFLAQHGVALSEQMKGTWDAQDRYEKALKARAEYTERLRVLRVALVQVHSALLFALNVCATAEDVRQLI